MPNQISLLTLLLQGRELPKVPPSKVNFTTMPSEIHQIIFGFLIQKDIKQLRLVSRAIHA